jgi:hypothetical protein
MKTTRLNAVSGWQKTRDKNWALIQKIDPVHRVTSNKTPPASKKIRGIKPIEITGIAIVKKPHTGLVGT